MCIRDRIGSNIKENLEKSIAKQIEGKCIAEGYIRQGSTEIVTFSSGLLKDSYVNFEIIIQCMICCPVEGMLIDCEIKNITKAGLRAETKEDISPVVIEANEVGHGASGRNNGLVIPTLSKADPEEIIRIFGQEKGEQTIALIRDSAGLVFNLIRKHNMEKAGEQTGWIQPAHSPGRMKLIEKRVTEWSKRGLKADLLDKEQLEGLVGSSAGFGGWKAHDVGTIHTMAYVRGMAKAVVNLGARIFTNSPAISLTRDDNGWLIRTKNGSVKANRVILATNAYTDDLWPKLRRTIIPVKTWQMATKPLSDNIRKAILPGRHGLSDTRGDLEFARYDWDGRLVSGASLIFDINSENRLRAHVGKRLQKNFPQLGQVEWEFIWSGFLSMTTDYLPRLHVLAPGVFTWLHHLPPLTRSVA